MECDRSITISKDSIKIENKRIIIYKNIFSKEPINVATKKDKKLEELLVKGIVYHDMKIIKTITNKYYLCFVEERNIQSDNNIGVVAVDPGGRTFMTTYSETEVMSIGGDMNDKIGKMIKRREHIKKLKNKLRYLKEEEKIRNKIMDFHYKAITKLMKYSLILIPKMDTKKILKEKKIPKAARKIITIENHRKFMKRLEDKCKEYNKEMRITSEYLTTKLCGQCFNINNIGSNKIYNCKICKLNVDRDINAARNIYITGIIEQALKY